MKESAVKKLIYLGPHGEQTLNPSSTPNPSRLLPTSNRRLRRQKVVSMQQFIAYKKP